MMTRHIRQIVISVVVYLLLFVLGICLICLVPYHFNSDLHSLAEAAATQYIDSGEVNRLGYRKTIGVFFCGKGETAPVPLYGNTEGTEYADILTEYVMEYKAYHKLFQLDCKLNPLRFYGIASEPIYIENILHGSIYLICPVTYLPAIVITFTIFYTVVYVLILGYIFLLRNTSLRIEHIYNQYIANVSHELKSPISAIHAITETLNSGLINDEQTAQRYLAIIDREAHRLEQSVLDIIALSKLQEKRVSVNRQRVDVPDILNPIQNRYAEFCEDIGISLIIHSSIYNLPPLYTDAHLFTQLMQILLDNAMKFTPSDGSITIEATVRHHHVVFSVHDTGCGMDSETLKHVFERFYRGKTSPEIAGSGLGLSIAHEITNLLGGKIWADSTLGSGSCFSFSVSCLSGGKLNRK